jgi:aminopeptidase N
LVGPDGQDLPLQLEGEHASAGNSRVLSVKRAQEAFRFVNVAHPPVPSLLRGFSAPVILRYESSDEQLTHLLAHDSDSFNRWEAGQQLALNVMLRGVADLQAGRTLQFPAAFADAFERVLADGERDPAFTAEALNLPSEGYVGEQMEVVDPDAIHAVRVGLRCFVAQSLRGELLAAYQAFGVPGPYSPDARSAGQRALKNLCLSYLMELDDTAVRALCLKQFDGANNMTDAIAALMTLVNSDCAERAPALERFYAKWKDQPLVVDKWLSVQANSRLAGTLAEVKRLTAHPAFDLKNPNKVYALIRSFGSNQVRFHAADGAGYAFLADQIRALDPLNPQIAARLSRAFDRWRKFDSGRQQHARAALERIKAMDRLSKDTLEVITKALA